MRRNDRAVREPAALIAIIERCKTCHVAALDADMPYVVPLSFGYELTDGRLTLYFHSAKEGRKLELLRKNNRAAFSMCYEGEPVFAENRPCNSGYYFGSVLGTGEVAFVEEAQEKCAALTRIMERQTGRSVAFTVEQADTVCVFKLVSQDYSGKRKQRPEG